MLMSILTQPPLCNREIWVEPHFLQVNKVSLETLTLATAQVPFRR